MAGLVRRQRRPVIALVAVLLAVAATWSMPRKAGAEAGLQLLGADGRPLTAPLLAFNDLLPGQAVSGTFQAVNVGNGPATLSLAGATAPNAMPAAVAASLSFTVAVERAGRFQEVWSGDLNQLARGSFTLSTVGVNQALRVAVTARLSAAADNEAEELGLTSTVNVVLTDGVDGSHDQALVLGTQLDRGAPALRHQTGSRLAFTGSPTLVAGAVGLLAIAAGLCLQQLARRRQPRL